MNDIGRVEIEAHIRTLVSEGFAKPLDAAGGGSERADAADQTAPPPAADQPRSGKKKNERWRPPLPAKRKEI